VDEVGRWTTRFEREIESEQELVEELRAGRFAAANQAEPEATPPR
jgi:hypothetical protein